MKYRFIVAQGSSLEDQQQRQYFPPALQGVSTAQHMSKSVIRLACSRAVVCGVSLRHIALRLSALFRIPMTKASSKRWSDDMGTNVPTPAQRLQHLRAVMPVTACPIDGDDPLGTDHWVMVLQEAHDRILMTHEVASEHGADARKFLQHGKDLGRNVTAAFSADSQSFTAAIQAVVPQARLQADHLPTVKNIWEKRQKSLLS